MARPGFEPEICSDRGRPAISRFCVNIGIALGEISEKAAAPIPVFSAEIMGHRAMEHHRGSVAFIESA